MAAAVNAQTAVLASVVQGLHRGAARQGQVAGRVGQSRGRRIGHRARRQHSTPALDYRQGQRMARFEWPRLKRQPAFLKGQSIS